MPIAIDGVILAMQPDSIDWQRRIFGTTGLGQPVHSPYYTCILGFSRTTVVELEEWHRILGEFITIHLPHPKTGKMTEYTDVVVRAIEERMNIMNNDSTLSGVDITLVRIDAST